MTMEKEDYEKIARLETQISNLTTVITRMDSKLDMWNENFVPRKEIYEMFRARDKEIGDIGERLEKQIEESSNNKSILNSLPNWIGMIIAVISMLIMVYELNK